ncbi:MAG: hypothetical protein [Circoviridae sp.]|nr:MAG: hypothetical protein [Circoviridae sp.]
MKTEEQMIAECDYDGLMEQTCDFCNTDYYVCTCPMVQGGHPWHRTTPEVKETEAAHEVAPPTAPTETRKQCGVSASGCGENAIERSGLVGDELSFSTKSNKPECGRPRPLKRKRNEM